MGRRLLLVRHAPTAATRRAAFPGDDELDAGGRMAAGALPQALPRGYGVISSPAAACRQTAAAAGLGIDRVDAALRECDYAAWVGLALAQIAVPDVRSWMTDPDAAPHGGESLRCFAARVAAWLDAEAGRNGADVAITHGGVVKAALVHALRAPLDAFWRVDVAPLTITELHAHGARWTVTRVNQRMPPAPPTRRGTSPGRSVPCLT